MPRPRGSICGSSRRPLLRRRRRRRRRAFVGPIMPFSFTQFYSVLFSFAFLLERASCALLACTRGDRRGDRRRERPERREPAPRRAGALLARYSRRSARGPAPSESAANSDPAGGCSTEDILSDLSQAPYRTFPRPFRDLRVAAPLKPHDLDANRRALAPFRDLRVAAPLQAVGSRRCPVAMRVARRCPEPSRG